MSLPFSNSNDRNNHDTSMTATKYEWTPQTIQRFWEHYKTGPESQYFCYWFGTGLTNFLVDTGRVKPGILYLDYGCGQGFLLERMLAKQVRCYGVDGSFNSVQFVNQRFDGDYNWMGATTVSESKAVLPAGSFDLISCIETLEHVLGGLEELIGDIYQLLKPGGVALFTTPNEENLEHSQIYCPFCEAIYHKVQHLRSFSSQSLTSLLDSQGLKTIFCGGLDLSAFQQPWTLPNWRDVSFRHLANWFTQRKHRLFDKLAPRVFPDGRGFKYRLNSVDSPCLCAVVERPLVQQ
jgi:2-polyprenyl-3-methyl-5-hydroxy-6-metoxy-1,4-benzoquinol methylase